MLQPGEILFISSHNWDIAGAANAGMKTAFLDNGNQLLYPLAKSPTLRVKNVELLAQQLKEAFS
jgi:2-haloacid dehalogenase